MMDYKYINQLLERYWRGETSLEEEDILRAFFNQDNVPAELMSYKPLFSYMAVEPKEDVLGDDFDERLLNRIEGGEQKVVKAHTISITDRIRPLFRAAAVIAIILTLGNAMQVSFAPKDDNSISNYDGYYKPELDKGTSVAIGDTASIDTMQQSLVTPVTGSKAALTE